MDYERLLALVKKRRSIRRFRPDPIPAEYIDKIIEVARWAPSGFNTQPWEFVVVRGPDCRSAILKPIYDAWAKRPPDKLTDIELHHAENSFSVAPVFIILCGDVRTKIGLPRGAQEGSNFSKVFISSLAGAFLYMHLAAASLGLASQWVSNIGFPPVDVQVKKILGIPEDFMVYDMIALGYPAVRSRPKLVRTRESMTHYDFCKPDDFRADAAIHDYARKTRTWTLANHRRQADADLLK